MDKIKGIKGNSLPDFEEITKSSLAPSLNETQLSSKIDEEKKAQLKNLKHIIHHDKFLVETNGGDAQAIAKAEAYEE